MRKIFKVIIASLITLLPAGITGQTTSDGSMPQYLFRNFDRGRVLMKNGQVQSAQMNYNFVTERMVFIRDGNYFDMTNPEMVDTVYIQGRKFVPAGKVFHEVVFSGAIDLFIEHKGELLPAGKPAGYGGTSQLSSSNYVTSVRLPGGQYNLPLPPDYIIKGSTVHWIRKGGEMSEFQNEKQFLKLFPDKSDQLKSFIKENRLKFDRTDHLIKLMGYLSTL
jgi:hypothetical protein